jgi:hypothetical protein
MAHRGEASGSKDQQRSVGSAGFEEVVGEAGVTIDTV